MGIVARAVAEEADAADVRDVDVELGPAAVVQRRRAVVERIAVAQPGGLRVPDVVEHLPGAVDLIRDPVRRVGVGGRRRIAVRRVVVPVEAERPAALTDASRVRVEIPVRLAEERGGAVGAGKDRLRLRALGACEEARPREEVAEDEGRRVRVRAGDMAELGADPAQREERAGTRERVLRLGQPPLVESPRERVVLGGGERRQRPRGRRERARLPTTRRWRAGGRVRAWRSAWLCDAGPRYGGCKTVPTAGIGVLLRPR